MPVLRVPAPYDFHLSTRRFRAFGPDLANLWHDGGVHRVVGGREVRIEAAPGGVRVEPLNAETRPVVRHLLGLPFDLCSFTALAADDRVLAPLAARLRGLRPVLAPDPFESLVTSITAQQVSLFAAFAIRNRLIERFGVRAHCAYAFPTRERLAVADPEELLPLGFSRRKAEYVVGLARFDVDLEALAGLEDDAVREQIRAVRGLGDWTAEWFLARHLARPGAWPAGDLSVRKALGVFVFGGQMPSIDEARRAGARFAPHRNLSAHYLLAALASGEPRRDGGGRAAPSVGDSS